MGSFRRREALGDAAALGAIEDIPDLASTWRRGPEKVVDHRFSVQRGDFPSVSGRYLPLF